MELHTIEFRNKEWQVELEEKNHDGDLNYVARLVAPILREEFGEQFIWKHNGVELTKSPSEEENIEKQELLDQITAIIIEKLH